MPWSAHTSSRAGVLRASDERLRRWRGGVSPRRRFTSGKARSGDSYKNPTSYCEGWQGQFGHRLHVSVPFLSGLLASQPIGDGAFAAGEGISHDHELAQRQGSTPRGPHGPGRDATCQPLHCAGIRRSRSKNGGQPGRGRSRCRPCGPTHRQVGARDRAGAEAATTIGDLSVFHTSWTASP